MADCLVDGRPEREVPIDDRGLLYGDHLFETIAFVGHSAPLWEKHMARLEAGAGRLLMPVPDTDRLAADSDSLVAGHPRSVVRITFTRGSGGRAYTPPASVTPRRLVSRRPWPATLDRQRAKGIEVDVSPVRLAVGGELAGVKHGNRLEQVLAAEHARRAGHDEALLFDADDNLVEAVSGNLIVWLEGRAVTPPIDRCGVRGVGLGWLREQAGVRIDEDRLGPGDLERAEAIVVINSVAGIRPVRALGGRLLPVSEACRHWQRLWNVLFECEA